MLTMEQIYHIRFESNQKGKSLRGIAKDEGINFRTVKKYAEMENFNTKKQACSRRGKLQPYEEIIDQWLTDDLKAKPKQRHTAKRVYDRLKEIYGDTFDISDRSVRAYVSKKRKELTFQYEGSLPLEHEPGEAQADFGECQFVEKGIMYDGYYINLSFPNSNGGYLQVFKSQNQECLLEGLKNIFYHIGGVPKEIWFDNMSSVVDAIREEGKRDINKGFLRFMMHHKFFSNFCNPNSGNEKGHVENKVGYHRRNFLVPIPEFDDIEEFNQRLLKMCDNDMNRGHYKKNVTISELFKEDEQALLPLPKIPFEVCRLEKAKADNYGKVKFDGRIYSSSPEFAGKQLWVKAGANTIEVMDEDYHTIMTHPRLYGAQKESMKWEPYLDLMAKRPTALKYTGFFKGLPSTIRDYFEKCDYESKKAGLRILSRMVKRSGIEVSTKAFEKTIEKGLTDVDSIWAYYCRMTMAELDFDDMEVPSWVPEVKEYSTDASIYDSLLKGGDRSWKQ
jgi:transposase